MVKVIKPKGKIGPREQAVREMRENDLSIPSFLRRKPETPEEVDARLKKQAAEAKLKKLPILAKGTEIMVLPSGAGGTTQESAMRTSSAKKTTKAPAKSAKKAETTPAKKRASANARTPVDARKDGLREGSKQAKLIDAALAAGKKGIAEADLCKKLGWKRCAVTLRRVCARVGARIERVDGRFVVTV